MSVAEHYAYIHCKPDGTPFYVGKGSGDRFRVSGARNPYYRRTVNKYGAKNILIGTLHWVHILGIL
jgi:hypothetical protein